MVPSKTARSVWNPSRAPLKSGISSVKSTPDAASCSAARVVTAATSRDIGTTPKSGLKAIRFGGSVDDIAVTKLSVVSKEKGSSG